jgi:hypothetical protein
VTIKRSYNRQGPSGPCLACSCKRSILSASVTLFEEVVIARTVFEPVFTKLSVLRIETW